MVGAIETEGAATPQSAEVLRCGSSPKCECHEDPSLLYKGRARPETRGIRVFQNIDVKQCTVGVWQIHAVQVNN